MSEFSYRTGLQVRFRDLDAMGHVNNAVYATYLEQARRDYFVDVLDLRLEVVDTVLASISIDFCAPIDGDGDVTISICVSSIGSSSIEMEYEVRDGETVAATGETVQVVIDRETGESRTIPDEWREKLESYEELSD